MGSIITYFYGAGGKDGSIAAWLFAYREEPPLAVRLLGRGLLLHPGKCYCTSSTVAQGLLRPAVSRISTA